MGKEEVKKACAGGITPKVYRFFKYDISPIVKRECRTIKINLLNKKPFFVKDENTLCYMTKREEVDLFSLNKVMDKGGVLQVSKDFIKNILFSFIHKRFVKGYAKGKTITQIFPGK